MRGPAGRGSADAEARYEAPRVLARARGFRYLDAGAVAKLPVEDVVERAALTADTIQLDCDVSYISLEPEGRQFKSHYGCRVIPLKQMKAMSVL